MGEGFLGGRLDVEGEVCEEAFEVGEYEDVHG